MDAGRLSDSQGRVVNFKNTVIIMTSNLGAQYINDAPEGPVSKETKALINNGKLCVSLCARPLLLTDHHFPCFSHSRALLAGIHWST